MNVDEAAELSKNFKSISKTFSEVAEAVSGTVQAVKPIKRLAGCPKSGGLGSKLITAGMACIIFPEPVISEITGSMLIAAGVLIESRRGPTITDVFREIRRITNDLRKINVEI
ncbi:MAG: hypothetical protein N3E47_02575 [Candidatus Bathyarchaeota archaeon]|nr:hypothetical protein [Candidatus Bathyarchaeota archaeon]